MKLSNQQIQAVVNEIAKKENLKLDEDYKKSKKALEKQKKPIAKKYFNMYNSLPDDLRKFLSPYNQVTEARILQSLVKSVERKSFNRSDIENKIIIASIECNNLDELKKKLNLKF